MSAASCRTLHDGVALSIEEEAKHSVAGDAGPELDDELDLTRYKGSGTREEPFVVVFKPSGDGDNPYEWPSWKKWIIVMQVSMACLCTAFGSSIYAGGLRSLEEHFNASHLVMTLGLSLYVCGFATGPLLWGGLSEWLGRRNVFLMTYVPFVFFNFGCTMSTNSLAGLLTLRFFAGTFGSSALVLSGAQVADLFNQEERAVAMSVFALAPFMGPVLGPIVGGFMGPAVGWRWILALQTSFSIVMTITGAFVPETYGPYILERRARRLAKLYPEHHFVTEQESRNGKQPPMRTMWINLTRPFVFLVSETIVFLFALYAAIVYGTLYSLFISIPIVFQETRGWSPGVGGLAFLGMGVAQVIASICTVWISKRYVAETARKGPLPPEARLSSCIIGGACIPVGMFWFAWTCQPSVHFIVPIIGSSLFGFGSVLLFIGMSLYMVDAYTIYAGSTLAANAVFRSILGAVFPLFVAQMFHAMGNSLALTVFAAVSLSLVPIPLVFIKWGPRIRARSKYAPGHAEPSGDTLFRTKAELVEEVYENDLARQRTHEAVHGQHNIISKA